MTLHDKLERRIRSAGPMTVAEFMTACLHDPEDGYYATRPRLGPMGDFITAPLVSQMFGELLGLWAVETWMRLDRPSPFRLIELGPGDGALMQDVLRAARMRPDFRAAADLWLVEASGPLRALQKDALEGENPQWSMDLHGVPDGAPSIVLANEFLDCLPARQFMRVPGGWRERVIGALDGRLVFGLAPAPAALISAAWSNGRIGDVFEVSPQQLNLARTVSERIKTDGGCALFIDYGAAEGVGGDTLQALQRHAKVDPLVSAGEADLTVHADFPGFVAAAHASGAAATEVRPQGPFLLDLGLMARAASLSRARPDLADAIGRQAARLTSPNEMGELFKVVAIHRPGLEVPGLRRGAEERRSSQAAEG